MFLRAFMPWLHLDATFALSSLGRLQKKCLKVLHGMTKRVIKRRKEQIFASGETEKPGADSTDPTDFHDIGNVQRRRPTSAMAGFINMSSVLVRLLLSSSFMYFPQECRRHRTTVSH
jgi:hypothetical protein